MEVFAKLFIIMIITLMLLALLGVVLDWPTKIIRILFTSSFILSIIFIDILIILS